MWNAIKALLESKKFLATAAGVLVAVLAKVGLHLPEETVNQVLALIAAFVVGQGIADHGKEAAKIAAAAAIAAAAKALEAPKP